MQPIFTGEDLPQLSIAALQSQDAQYSGWTAFVHCLQSQYMPTGAQFGFGANASRYPPMIAFG